MPFGVRQISICCILLATFLPLTLLPGGEVYINGDRVSYFEFWQRGGAFLMLAIEVVCIVLCHGLVAARKWVRPLIVFSGWALLIIVGIWGDEGLSLGFVWGVFLFGLLPTWYFYFRNSVKNYFGAGIQNNNST